MVRPTAEKKHLAIELNFETSLGTVSGDPMRLQQVASNLLTNAVKFTPDGGRVAVTIDSVKGAVRLRVSDSGIGIEPGFQPRIFERFSQEVFGQTRLHGGLGLGLAIVRYVVDAHGGSVEAESAGRGKGSTFTVVLPVMRTKPAACRKAQSPRKPPAGV